MQFKLFEGTLMKVSRFLKAMKEFFLNKYKE